jgi:hypothetical protein
VSQLRSLVIVAVLSALATPAFCEVIGGGPVEGQVAPEFGEKPRQNYESSQWFALELKFGPYSPDIDSSPGLNSHPFADLFNPADKHHGRPGGRLLTQIEFDFQFLHRSWGSLGIGHTLGYYRRFTHAVNYIHGDTMTPCSLEKGECVASGDITALNIIPLSILAVYRFDYLARRYKIPFVPYVKAGLAYYIWWIENGSGGVATYRVPMTTQTDSGYGGTFGWVLNPGLAFLLDVIDPSAARTMDAELGINHTYLFFEMHYADITGFGAPNKMTLSDLTWNTGITFEF